MVVIYAYTTFYVRKQILTKVKLEEKNLLIDFKYPSNYGRADACVPYTRFLVIKMNKVDYETIEVHGDIS